MTLTRPDLSQAFHDDHPTITLPAYRRQVPARPARRRPFDQLAWAVLSLIWAGILIWAVWMIAPYADQMFLTVLVGARELFSATVAHATYLHETGRG